ncbi:SDR family oxidoreductase [Chromobacterium piscinae]|uniref:SDR family oxidoreductase n=1 Tax=Chromobacterium piscinae TaxID=686831 RepID=A0ABV0H0H5_9NEIS
MSKILITGANGFIGSALYSVLSQQEFNIVPVVRKPSSLKNELIIGDISVFNSWSAYLNKVDCIIHLAGRAHILNDKVLDPLSEFRNTNTHATLTLAKQAASAGVKRFIFLSSIGVNGNETIQNPFHFDDEPHPHSPYAISKYEAEIGLKEISAESGLEIVIIRPPLVYGENAPGNFRSLMRWLSLGVPLPFGAVLNNRRSFVSLDNLISLIITCIKHPAAANQTFLASDGEDLSTTELLQRLCNAIGKNSPLIKIPPKIISFGLNFLGKEELAKRLLGSLQVDITHTCNTLSWKPPFSIDEGLKRATHGH